jgi:protocatechuate 3,4-dioxygenase beta subunit
MPRLISGLVTDREGHGVAGARVALSEAPTPVPDIAAITDSEGRFTLSVPGPGDYAVRAFADDHPPANLKVSVDQDINVVLTLGRSD